MSFYNILIKEGISEHRSSLSLVNAIKVKIVVCKSRRELVLVEKNIVLTKFGIRCDIVSGVCKRKRLKQDPDLNEVGIKKYICLLNEIYASNASLCNILNISTLTDKYIF